MINSQPTWILVSLLLSSMIGNYHKLLLLKTSKKGGRRTTTFLPKAKLGLASCHRDTWEAWLSMQLEHYKRGWKITKGDSMIQTCIISRCFSSLNCLFLVKFEFMATIILNIRIQIFFLKNTCSEFGQRAKMHRVQKKYKMTAPGASYMAKLDDWSYFHGLIIIHCVWCTFSQC